MSSWWGALEIDATTDLKVIKSAYAIKLKSTRPDEKPEEFQQLHKAYKQALAYAKSIKKHNKNAIMPESEGTIPVMSIEPVPNEVVPAEKAINVNVEQKSTVQQQENNTLIMEAEYKTLTSKIDEVLMQENKRNKQNEWQFLIQSQFILDNEFNLKLGLAVLHGIDNHNIHVKAPSNVSKRKRQKYISANATVRNSTIEYLDTVFNWSAQLNVLEHYLDEAQYSRLRLILENNRIQTKFSTKIKGGTVNEVLPKTEADFTLVNDAYDNVIKLSGYLTVVLIAALSFAIFTYFGKDNYNVVAILVGIIAYLGMQWFALKARKKFAYNSMWFFSFISLFSFPIGTALGGIIIVNLYRARKYYK